MFSSCINKVKTPIQDIHTLSIEMKKWEVASKKKLPPNKFSHPVSSFPFITSDVAVAEIKQSLTEKWDWQNKIHI